MRSGPGAARIILLFHIISARPSKQPLMVRVFLEVYGARLQLFVSARTIKRHHHRGEEGGGGVRSGPGAARTILLFHIIGARLSKHPLMVRVFLKVYGAGLFLQ